MTTVRPHVNGQKIKRKKRNPQSPKSKPRRVGSAGRDPISGKIITTQQRPPSRPRVRF